MNTIILLMMAVVWLFSIAFAEDYATTFLRVSPDAISRSIGGPNQAYLVGAADIFINPALMSQHNQKRLQFSSIIESDLLQYVNSTFSMPLYKVDHIGVGILWMNIPDIQEIYDNHLYAGEFDSYQFVIAVGYSRNISQFSVGSTIKYLRIGFSSKEINNPSNSLGVDFGLHYTFKKMFRFGFIYQNFFEINRKNTNSDLSPRKIGVGVSLEPPFVSKDFLKVLLSLYQIEDEPVQMNIVLILTPITNKVGLNSFSVRAGMAIIIWDLKNKQMFLKF
jgi:long-subunit fatty acid transport protein